MLRVNNLLLLLSLCKFVWSLLTSISKDFYQGVFVNGSKIGILHVLLDNDCSIRVYQSFVAVFQKYLLLSSNAFSDLLCSNYAGAFSYLLWSNYAGIIGYLERVD